MVLQNNKRGLIFDVVLTLLKQFYRTWNIDRLNIVYKSA